MEEGSKPDNSTPVAEEQEELEEDYEDYEYDENGKVIYVYGAGGGKEPKLSPLGNCKKNLWYAAQDWSVSPGWDEH